MTHDQHSMAEMAGGIEEAQTDAVQTAAAHGVDAEAVVAAELAAEGNWTPADAHLDPTVVPSGLAALEAETEE
jgi:hypothetical protein